MVLTPTVIHGKMTLIQTDLLTTGKRLKELVQKLTGLVTIIEQDPTTLTGIFIFTGMITINFGLDQTDGFRFRELR